MRRLTAVVSVLNFPSSAYFKPAMPVSSRVLVPTLVVAGAGGRARQRGIPCACNRGLPTPRARDIVSGACLRSSSSAAVAGRALERSQGTNVPPPPPTPYSTRLNTLYTTSSERSGFLLFSS